VAVVVVVEEELRLMVDIVDLAYVLGEKSLLMML
jgi:hypothetical protein